MLDSPDDLGLYNTTTCFIELEHYIEKVRVETIGWTHSFLCSSMDKGNDPRFVNVQDIYSQAAKDLQNM